MKKILLFCAIALMFSCSSSDDASIQTENVTLFVNHFKTTSLLSGTTFLVQENDAIGTNTYKTAPVIENFDFQPGYTYSISAEKTITENAGTDAATTAYRVIDVLEKKQVGAFATFNVPLTTFTNGVGYISFISGSEATGFRLSGQIEIDCREFCGELEGMIQNKDIATATFIHGPEGSYILQELY